MLKSQSVRSRFRRRRQGAIAVEFGMVLPLMLVVLDIYPLRRLSGRWQEWTGAAARRVLLEKIPFMFLGVAGAALGYYAQNANAFITPLERYPLSARPAMVFYSLWFYLEKTVVPQGLSPLYELPERVNLLEYGQQASRRLALAILFSPMLAMSKSRRHYLTVGYTDDDGRQNAMVFTVDKNDIRTVLATLEARTGRKVEFQDEEARRAGRG